ncbi:AAA family ATPase [Sulfitobacter sp. 1A13368]|uniref:AAA family ATPase n=1 Tax=Sulfitobacter sp. 1A13368 TaxID=3368593 RepID=UPI003745E3E6
MENQTQKTAPADGEGMPQADTIKNWSSDAVFESYVAKPWTISKLMETSSIAWIYGEPGSMKSYVALDIACCVATGSSWCGRNVRKGPVLYVSAEGGSGLHGRRIAWERDRGIRAEHLKIISMAPDITKGFRGHRTEILEGLMFGVSGGDYIPNPIVAELEEMKAATGDDPALVIFDTYAQTAPDDNKNTVTAYTKALVDLTKRFPSLAVLVIDHTTKEGGTWMGSQAKLGNIDMMAMAVRRGDEVTLTMRAGKGKVKNAKPFNDIKLAARVVDLGCKDADGENAANLVLDYQRYSLTSTQTAMLALIGDGTTYGELRDAWKTVDLNEGKQPGTIRKSMSDALSHLEGIDVIQVEGKTDNSAVFPK